MFTGIIETIGVLKKIQKTKAGLRFGVATRRRWAKLKIGESVAINGVCLTLVKAKGSMMEFDVARESLKVTTLRLLKEGSLVHLERALRLGDSLGGHMVSGHVDGIGHIQKIQKTPNGAEWTVSLSKDLARFVIHKGSITINGVSLTVNKVSVGRRPSFSVFLIPHTLKATHFYRCLAGDAVNLEVDMWVKTIEKILVSYTGNPPRPPFVKGGRHGPPPSKKGD